MPHGPFTPRVNAPSGQEENPLYAIDAEHINDMQEALEDTYTVAEVDDGVSDRGIDWTVGPFYRNDLAATADEIAGLAFFNTDTALSRSNNHVDIPRAGKIVAVIVVSDAARSAGTLTARPRINGFGNSGITAVLDGTNTTSKSTLDQTGVSVNAGDDLTCSVVTSSWGPTTANVSVWLVLRLDDF